jgi:hypothetical protein
MGAGKPIINGDILTEKDFDTKIKYLLFTKFYSIDKSLNNNDIKEWEVIGYSINISKDKRNVEYILISSPISIYFSQNAYTHLEELELSSYISPSKDTIIRIKKELLNEYFHTELEKLK